jgi:Zn-dependent protease with chaperone function
VTQVNGLFGWMEYNDRRSLGLFAAFIAAFHLLALPTLLVFLALFDRAHAPFFNWTGYALRYGPLLTAFGAIAFAVGAWSHLREVRKALPFRPVDVRSAPRLWRIFEPLAIAAGLPGTRLAILDASALNAFAFGFARRNATVVVTRALVDALDDDELAAVLAHELTHIGRGDVRYLIAANACLYAIRSLATVELEKERNNSLKGNRLLSALVEDGILTHEQAIAMRDFLGGLLLVIVLPFALLVLLTVLLMRRQLLNLGDAIRLSVLSSREYLADAGSVELTKNPAALVSALRLIEGRGRLPKLLPEYAAMMIEAERSCDGPTHPTVPQRVAALASVTGGMAFIASSRRDTRPGAARGFGRRLTTVAVPDVTPAPPSLSVWQAWLRVAAERGYDVFGVRPAFGFGLAAAVPAYLFINSHQIDQPRQLLSAFDPRAAAVFAELGGWPTGCPLASEGIIDSPCTSASEAELAALAQQRNMLGIMARMKIGDDALRRRKAARVESPAV